MFFVDPRPDSKLIDFVDRLIDSGCPSGIMLKSLMMLLHDEDGEELNARCHLFIGGNDDFCDQDCLAWISRHPRIKDRLDSLPGFRRYQQAYRDNPAPDPEAVAFWLDDPADPDRPEHVPDFADDPDAEPKFRLRVDPS